METPPDEDWEFVWVPLHAWAEIRSSPKIPLSILSQQCFALCVLFSRSCSSRVFVMVSYHSSTVVNLVQFGPTLELFFRFLVVFFVFGVREWSKNAPGTRTIIFPVSIPHIVHSRPISTQFWHFRPSPILCISARQRMFFFCNKKIQSKSFISPLWRIRFVLGHEKSV